MVWVIERYLKYLSFFFVAWGLIWATRTFQCSYVDSGQMAPIIPKDGMIYFDTRGRSPDAPKLERQKTLLYYHQMIQVGMAFQRRFVGRLIGLPGDKVALEKGKLKLNGQIIGEEYVRDPGFFRDDFPEITVPRDHFFLMGDYRADAGGDSRALGPISVHSVLGIAAPVGGEH